MKLTRGEKRRRKLAKLVEMKLDGIDPPNGWRTMNFEELYRYHQYALRRIDVYTNPKYYGKSLADYLTMTKAQELQRAIDRQIMEELNGKSNATD